MVGGTRAALQVAVLHVVTSCLFATGSERPVDLAVQSQKAFGAHIKVSALQSTKTKAQHKQKSSYGPTSESINCDKPDPVHVMYTVDAAAVKYTAASVYSALKNAKEPGRLRFHFMVPTYSDAQAMCQMLHKFEKKKRVSKKHLSFMCPRSSVPSFSGYQHQPPSDCKSAQSRSAACVCSSQQFHFVVLENVPALLAKIKKQIKLSMERHSPDRYDDLTNIPNFSRNWAYEVLQPLGIKKILYIDADTIVKGDLGELWSLQFEEGKAVMIATNCKNKMAKHFSLGNKIIRALIGDPPPSCMYNTGVIVMDVDELAEMKVGEKIDEMYVEHKKNKLWRKGIQQSAFILAVYQRIQSLDSVWNTTGLGRGRLRLSSGKIDKAKILHWTGSRKPWLPDGNFKSYWTPYSV